MASEQSRVLSLAANMGVSRVALQSDDLLKLTDSSSDGIDYSSDEDDDTAPVKAEKVRDEWSGRKREAKRPSRLLRSQGAYTQQARSQSQHTHPIVD